MNQPLLFPKLRYPLDITIHTEGTQPTAESYIIFRCPVGIVQPYVLTASVGPIVARFTGTLSIDEIAHELAPLGATRQLVADVVSVLDEHLLLESPRFFERFHTTVEEFRAATVRQPAHAGGAYPQESAALDALIHSFMTPKSDAPPPPLVGLMVPHIDYRRGGSSYGIGYSALRSTRPDVIVLLGTAHQASRHLFHLTKKDFSSPTRFFANDTSSSQFLAQQYGVERSFEDEFLHKHEHSLELQLPFLSASITSPTQIVPILVGSFHQFVREGRYPSEYEPYQTFVGALEELCIAIRREGRSLLLVAGVDMAHCGMAFGDQSPLSEADREMIRQRDAQYLGCIRERNLQALFSHVAEDLDARRLCGFPTMYLMTDLLNRLGVSTTPSILDYQVAFDPTSDTCVTFGAASFPLSSYLLTSS